MTSASSSIRRGLLLAALGVVYGDIGTSPLYAIKVSVSAMGQPEPSQILGLLSLYFWLIMLVVSLKYVMVVLRADNRGEGGTMALLELALRGTRGRKRSLLVFLGLAGTCLFYGDSMITPAISVLSAIEGLELLSPQLKSWVVPLSLVVLTILFTIQSRGTAVMGRLFGPVMLVWFLVLGGLGAWRITQAPEILAALNPYWAMSFIAQAPWQVYALLGAIVLAVTGSEALYADMGHFGRKVVQRAWFLVVLPSLVLCYFGQGALLLAQPSARLNPFYLLAPSWALIPMVVLAALATIIASQAVISGAFSVTRQAVQLGYWPRMIILHPSNTEGQIYLPRVNQALFVAVVVLVLVFQESDSLAHAYGFSNTGAMLVTSILGFFVMPRTSAGARRMAWFMLFALFLLIDLALFSSNAMKLLEGGWVPLLVGIVLLLMMHTWKLGRQAIHDAMALDHQPLRDFMQGLQDFPPARVAGTAIYMSMIPGTVPPALLHNLKHNKVLHEQTVFFTVEVADVPYVAEDESYTLQALPASSWQIIARWGFKQEPNVPRRLEYIGAHHPEIDVEPMRLSYFLSRQTVIVVRKAALPKVWQRRLFAFMSRNASRSTRFYKIPPNSVVEMGIQTEL
jgi:KUP system potassium uptake protein